MDEDNTIHGGASMGDSDEIHGAYAPPRYDDHYLDRLYDGLSHDRFETPLPSGANTPVVLSRNNSHENLTGLLMMDSGRISGAASPLRIPDASSGRWSANRSRASTPALSPPTTSGFSDDELSARLNNHSDYFSTRSGRSARSGSGPSTRTHSPDDLRGEDENLDVNELSKVPSYTTAVRQGTKNLGSTSSLPLYDNGSRSAPESTSVSPRHSPPTSYTMPIMNTGRGGHEGGRSRLWGRSLTTPEVHNVETGSGASGGHLAEVERRIRLLQLRGR